MILSNEAERATHSGKYTFDQLEVRRCPRCKQMIYITPDEIYPAGDVCEDCFAEWWEDLYEDEVL